MKEAVSNLTQPPDIRGAASGTRTHDLFVTNEMLYRLSYCGWYDSADCDSALQSY